MKLLKNWLSIFQLNMADDDVSSEPDDTELDEAPKQTVDEYVEEAVKALDEPKVEEPKIEEPKTEQPKQEEKKGQLTEDDLRPLDSKNINSNERFEKLTTSYKELAVRVADYEQLEQKSQGYEQAFNELQQLGFNDDESANSLVAFSEYRKTLQSGDVQKFQQAISNEIAQFELYTGKKVNIQASGLDGYEELKQRVERQELSEDDAIKIARLNNLESRASIQNQTQYQQQNEEQNRQQENIRVEQSITDLQAHLQKTDPDYQAVRSTMDAELQEIARSLPPAQWAKTIELVYNAKKSAMLQAQPQKQSFAPLRANSAKGGKPVFRNIDEQIAFDVSDENWSAV